MTVWKVLFVCGGIVGVSAGLGAQTTLTIGTRVGAGTISGSGYDDEGRRDPFGSLVAERPVVAAAPVRRAHGLAGLAMADVAVTGIITSGQTWIAIIAGPDGATYLARPNARLHDAVVRRIDRDAVVFVTQVADVTGAARAREVRRALRPSAGEAR